MPVKRQLGLAIESVARARSEDVALYAKNPSYRKATQNMKVAASVVDQLKAATASQDPGFESERIGLILGSSYGELGTTLDYLQSLSQHGVARPLLFQSSLHNATVGFLSMQFQLKGPTFTVSSRSQTSESALSIASVLLESGTCDRCWVVCVDLRPLFPQVLEAIEKSSPVPHRLGEGGSGLSLVLPKQVVRPQAMLKASCWSDEKDSVQVDSKCFEGAYDSDGLDKMISALEPPQRFETEPLVLRKPEGWVSRYWIRSC